MAAPALRRPAAAPLDEAAFEALRAFLARASGLALALDKAYLVEARLGPVLRRRGLASWADLAARLPRDPDLGREVVEAMATHETQFFRDRLPFDTFRAAALPRLLAQRAGSRRLRLWCAAVATGQEAYSLAMILDEKAAALAGWTVELLATDLSRAAIARAEEGLYSRFEVQRGLPIRHLLRHFEPEGEGWRIAPALRRAVRFEVRNLLDDATALGSFDLIFCRNLLIYFDADTKARVLRRLARQLQPGGLLVLGAAEAALGLTDALLPDPHHRGYYMRAADLRAAGVASA